MKTLVWAIQDAWSYYLMSLVESCQFVVMANQSASKVQWVSLTLLAHCYVFLGVYLLSLMMDYIFHGSPQPSIFFIELVAMYLVIRQIGMSYMLIKYGKGNIVSICRFIM